MFKNLVVLISGGASKLGQATANRLANKGAQIVLTDQPETNGATIAKEIGKNVDFMPADATSEQSIEIVLNDISKRYGKLNAVINCLGLEKARMDNKADDLDFFTDRLQTNLYGTFNMLRQSVKLMGANEPDEDYACGVIINTVGLDGIHRAEDRPFIAATYGSILGMTRSAAHDLASRGIRVNTIIPPLSESSLPEIKQFYKENNLVVASKLNNNPDGFAHVVQTIIANPYMNMSNVDMSGGVTRLL